MLKTLERVVLARILPKADAAARGGRCIPEHGCDWCGTSAYKFWYLDFRCNYCETGCRIPCASSC